MTVFGDRKATAGATIFARHFASSAVGIKKMTANKTTFDCMRQPRGTKRWPWFARHCKLWKAAYVVNGRMIRMFAKAAKTAPLVLSLCGLIPTPGFASGCMGSFIRKSCLNPMFGEGGCSTVEHTKGDRVYFVYKLTEKGTAYYAEKNVGMFKASDIQLEKGCKLRTVKD